MNPFRIIILLITLQYGYSKLTIPTTKKIVLVTGGVLSGVGKGICASSLGVIFKTLNLRPTAVKIDPYLNVDAGLMSPIEHGEVFVLDDGSETDLDLGNYERFLDIKLANDSNLTTGKIYQRVIARERKGEYLGKTVQIIPHITNEIQEQVLRVSKQCVDDSNKEPDVLVIELGGTIGDIESMAFVESLRQLQLKVKPQNFCIVHVSMVPTTSDGEQKTKPTQHSVKELRSLGLTPDFIICRSKNVIEKPSRDKIALFCNVPDDHVLTIPDVSNIYHVPLLMMDQHLHTLIAKRLGIRNDDNIVNSVTSSSGNTIIKKEWKSSDAYGEDINKEFANQWIDMVKRTDTATDEVTIALVGKYITQSDAYHSVTSSLKHACIWTNQKLKLKLVDSSNLEENIKDTDSTLYKEAWDIIKSADGILVPGGFGIRGIEGKVQAIKYSRENNVPFLGICLGMQAAVIEYTRSFLNRPLANSREFVPDISDKDASIIFMPEGDKEKLGGTMRLGSRRSVLRAGSKVRKLYNDAEYIDERHRHRYEVNPELVDQLEQKGLKFTGKDDTGMRQECVELDNHPYFVAVQFHPEFKSRPMKPSPVFLGLLEAAKQRRKSI